MRKFMIIIGSLIYSLTSLAQEQVEHTIPTDKVNVIVLKSNGQTWFTKNDKNSFKIRSSMQSKGKVRGISSPVERPVFDIEYKISSDTLYLITPQRFTPKVIGIMTYSETIKNTIELPKDKKLVVLEAEKLHFDGINGNVAIKSAKEVTFNSLTKANIAELECTATQSLYLNDEKKAKAFELYGYGNYYLMITANKIELEID